MKKTFLFIALVLCAALTVSCGNNGSSKSSAKKSKAEVAEEKMELAENVLARIDSLEQKCIESGSDYESVIKIMTSSLTEEQKLVKPDYLLDPSKTEDLLSLRQRVNALAILLTERPIREAYGMPLEKVDYAISRLYVEVGHPVTVVKGENPTSAELVKRAYEACKEDGNLFYFWQFDTAIQYNLLYLISFNTDTFFNNITPEQYKSFNTSFFSTSKAAHQLAEYDDEIATALEKHEESLDFSSVEEEEKILSDMEAGKAMIEKRHADYVNYRAWALL